jgi:FkbH-like protein
MPPPTASTDAPADALLRIASLPELRAAVARRGAGLSMAEARSAAERARQLCPRPQTLRLAVVHTYTSELLDPWLDCFAALQGLELAVFHAPYGLDMRQAQAQSALVAHGPDVTLLLLQRNDLNPALRLPVTAHASSERDRLLSETLQHLQQVVTAFHAQAVGQLVVSLLPEPRPPTLGLYDAQAENSERAWWDQLEVMIRAWLQKDMASCSWLDMADVQAEVGRRRFFDLRYWYASRYPFTPEAACEVARRVVAIGALRRMPRAKVIVLDADNTLWGGVVGEDGLDGIALGPDYPGNAFLAFQRRLLDFQQRGFLLAMCSKNNAADVDEVLQRHPHAILRQEHFAAMRVNWESKPDNLVSMAAELNLGLDSFVFVDDSDHECAAVRHRLPEVEVVQVPSRAVEVPSCLDHVTRLELLSLTAEDREKTAMYSRERERRAFIDGAASASGSSADYLQRLQMRMQVTLAPAQHVTRLAQLTQKTNQFNLTTRRLDEQRLRDLIASPDVLVADFSLADVFGNSGIVGLAVVQVPAGRPAEVDLFLMSCRVIGRCAGEAFLQAVLRELQARGVEHVLADYLPTAKNGLVRDFWRDQAFTQRPDGRWQRSLLAEPPLPASAFPIAVEWVPECVATH